VQQLHAFRPDLDVQISHAGQVSPGPVQARYKSCLDRVDRHAEDDRNCRGRGLGRHRSKRAAARNNHSDVKLNKFRRQLRQEIVLALRPTIFDRNVLALNISCLFQSLVEYAQTGCVNFRRPSAEKS
jgi:hypothetical protein